ncbi:hypothetical protein E2C01_021794 [Portunus trituberculatus]|uniref:Secreted protein n=1 Tax=Portunus trituberculatus TaxID=210409 RepID=A0A5B7E5K3_PORTR|nr:hypothetical protein [Portunus trituberculatus]
MPDTWSAARALSLMLASQFTDLCLLLRNLDLQNVASNRSREPRLKPRANYSTSIHVASKSDVTRGKPCVHEYAPALLRGTKVRSNTVNQHKGQCAANMTFC